MASSFGSLQEQLTAKFNSTPGSATKNTPTDAPTTTLGRILRLIEKVTGLDSEELDRDTPLEDLAIDSLDRIELAVRSEVEFSVLIDDDTLPSLSTIGEVAAWFDSQLAKAKQS